MNYEVEITLVSTCRLIAAKSREDAERMYLRDFIAGIEQNIEMVEARLLSDRVQPGLSSEEPK